MQYTILGNTFIPFVSMKIEIDKLTINDLELLRGRNVISMYSLSLIVAVR